MFAQIIQQKSQTAWQQRRFPHGETFSALHKHTGSFCPGPFPQHFGTQVFPALRSRLGHVDLLGTNFTQHRSKTLFQDTPAGIPSHPQQCPGDDDPAPAAGASPGNEGHTPIQVSLAGGAPTTPHQLYSVGLSSCDVPGWMASHFSLSRNTGSTWIPLSVPECSAFPRNSITKSVQLKGKDSASI